MIERCGVHGECLKHRLNKKSQNFIETGRNVPRRALQTDTIGRPGLYVRDVVTTRFLAEGGSVHIAIISLTEYFLLMILQRISTEFFVESLVRQLFLSFLDVKRACPNEGVDLVSICEAYVTTLLRFLWHNISTPRVTVSQIFRYGVCVCVEEPTSFANN